MVSGCYSPRVFFHVRFLYSWSSDVELHRMNTGSSELRVPVFRVKDFETILLALMFFFFFFFLFSCSLSFCLHLLYAPCIQWPSTEVNTTKKAGKISRVGYSQARAA